MSLFLSLGRRRKECGIFGIASHTRKIRVAASPIFVCLSTQTRLKSIEVQCTQDVIKAALIEDPRRQLRVKAARQVDARQS